MNRTVNPFILWKGEAQYCFLKCVGYLVRIRYLYSKCVKILCYLLEVVTEYQISHFITSFCGTFT